MSIQLEDLKAISGKQAAEMPETIKELSLYLKKNPFPEQITDVYGFMQSVAILLGFKNVSGYRAQHTGETLFFYLSKPGMDTLEDRTIIWMPNSPFECYAVDEYILQYFQPNARTGECPITGLYYDVHAVRKDLEALQEVIFLGENTSDLYQTWFYDELVELDKIENAIKELRRTREAYIDSPHLERIDKVLLGLVAYE